MTEVPKEARPVFGLAHSPTGPVLVVGLTDAAWEYSKNGQTLTLDLNRHGLPLQLVIFGCRDHKTAFDVIEGHNKRSGALASVREFEDSGIKDGAVRKSDLLNKVTR